jgi:hypothetical protein
MPNDNKYNSTNICECCFRSPHYSSVIADTGKCDKCGFIGDCWDCDLIDFYRSLPLSITDEEILEFLPRLQRKGLTSNKIYGLVEIGLRIKTCIEKRNDNNHSSLIADTGKRTGLSTHSLLEHLPTSLMPTQQANGSHSLIAITARSGGGKSLLAQSLNANIANGCLIDAGERCHYQHKSFDISPLITNNDITYIIDDSRYITCTVYVR